MATTPNYGWVTPAPTDFVTDLPADFETFADAVDDTVKDLNPGTTAGDLDYYTSGTAKARLAIGTSGQVLAVNSGATAPEWVTPAGGTNYTLLNAGGTSTNGVDTVTITGLSGYDKIFMHVFDVESPSIAAFTNFYVRLNTDSGSNYDYSGLLTTVNTPFDASYWTTQDTRNSSAIIFGQKGSSVNSKITGTFSLEGGNSSGTKVFRVTSGGNANVTGSKMFSMQGIWKNSATITSITFQRIGGSGNMGTGTIYVYGSA